MPELLLGFLHIASPQWLDITDSGAFLVHTSFCFLYTIDFTHIELSTDVVTKLCYNILEPVTIKKVLIVNLLKLMISKLLILI